MDKLRPHLVRLSYRYVDSDENRTAVEGEFVVSVNLPAAEPMELDRLRPVLRPLINARLNDGELWDRVDDIYVDWIVEVPQHDAPLWTTEHTVNSNKAEVNACYDVHCDSHWPGEWPDPDSDETRTVEPLFRLKAH